MNYYNIFDDANRSNRQKLVDAYSEDSTFTFTASLLTSNAEKSRSWSEMVRESHNIVAVSFWERFRAKLVHDGRLAVISCFCNTLPVTKHDFDSFVFDISLATDSLVCCNVTGIFHEIPAVDKTIPRFFTRVFLLLSSGSSVCIINDELLVSPLSGDLRTSYLHLLEFARTRTSEPANPVPEVLPGTAVVPNQVVGQNEEKLARVEMLARMTGMKPEWAEKIVPHRISFMVKTRSIVVRNVINKLCYPESSMIAHGNLKVNAKIAIFPE
ncbi:unnamed protein product [Soboliphyme baturini]|uniref:NTF2 domain-containing protein n=1 Tax=Soboliphyme baturini TaxID=241478 RepID=A0A183J341_9BILA|nr:unnamed protein product [Soboliphyme baturini]